MEDGTAKADYETFTDSPTSLIKLLEFLSEWKHSPTLPPKDANVTKTNNTLYWALKLLRDLIGYENDTDTCCRFETSGITFECKIEQLSNAQFDHMSELVKLAGYGKTRVYFEATIEPDDSILEQIIIPDPLIEDLDCKLLTRCEELGYRVNSINVELTY